MLLHERYRKFPISFYQDINTGKVYYESGFTQGEAKSLNDAFKEFTRDDFVRDLFYYYDDVSDVKFGQFIPPLKDKIKNSRKYLGKLEMELDINKNEYAEPGKSVAYLNKHREEIPNQLAWIKKMKRGEKIDKIKNSIIDGVKKLINKITVHEVFMPIKSTTELICNHCGVIIPIASYYEEYRNKNYHIECLWDQLYNNMPENDYKSAKDYFHSLEQYVGNWPAYGLDVEEDYVSDLELVKHNERTHRGNLLKETLDFYENLQEDS